VRVREQSPDMGQDDGAVSRAELARDRALVDAVLRRAALARTSPKVGFSFVMREEHGERRRITTLPHQRVMIDFLAQHDRANLRAFVGSSKTFVLTYLVLTLLGADPTARGAILSATQDQAKKPLRLVSQFIENPDNAFPELALVYPRLRPTRRKSEPWTQAEIVVDRPAGIRDPSLVAVGMDTGSLPGSRLSFIVLDDVLNEANTRTPEARKKVLSFLLSTVFTREDIRNTKIWNATQPWHPEDVTYVLQKSGWPTLEMDVWGNVGIWGAPDFDTDDIRPAARREGPYHRLTAHDSAEHGAPLTVAYPDGTRELARVGPVEITPVLSPGQTAAGARLEHFDLEEVVPLWPGKFGHAEIPGIRQKFAALPGKFAQAYEMNPRDDEQAACKQAWVDACKANGLAMGHRRMVSRYDGPNLTVTGVDLAVGKKAGSGKTSLFTYELLPTGKRKILNIQIGRWSGREIVTRVRNTERDFKSIERVESNAAQDYLRQWALDEEDLQREERREARRRAGQAANTAPPEPASLPLIRAHFTGREKHDPTYGVQGVFIAMENAVWVIPCEDDGSVQPEVQQWVEDCLYFRPGAHTGDVLMSCWLACEQEREVTRGRGRPDPDGEQQQSVAAALLSR